MQIFLFFNSSQSVNLNRNSLCVAAALIIKSHKNHLKVPHFTLCLKAMTKSNQTFNMPRRLKDKEKIYWRRWKLSSKMSFFPVMRAFDDNFLAFFWHFEGIHTKCDLFSPSLSSHTRKVAIKLREKVSLLYQQSFI